VDREWAAWAPACPVGVPSSSTPTAPTSGVCGVKACWIICTNPVASVANRKTVIAGLEAAATP
jgi:hypothetical protein